MANGQGLARASKKNFLMREQSPQADRMDMDISNDTSARPGQSCICGIGHCSKSSFGASV
jgi:hypothetical protein